MVFILKLKAWVWYLTATASSVMASMFPFRTKVQTHSLTATEYNGLEGVVTGPAVEKNGVMRVPVRLELSNGDKEDMRLQPKNLLRITSALDLELQKKLYNAVADGNVNAIRNYVRMGANINTSAKKDWTCMDLDLAAQNGHADVIRALTKHGADVITPDKNGSTHVLIAAREGHADVVRALAEHGADLNTPISG
jgi:ankyrin repeat protein